MDIYPIQNGAELLGSEATLKAVLGCVAAWYTQTDRHNGEKRDFDYNVKLVSTPCNYGGQRSWLVCPLGDCNRSVGTLYKGGDYFGCRHCYNLSYRSRNENRRSSFFPVGRFIEHDRKARELRESLNRQTYAGRPTRKARRVNALEQSSLRCGSLIKEI